MELSTIWLVAFTVLAPLVVLFIVAKLRKPKTPE